VQINVQGLLLGGMIIGTLGILDDLVTSTICGSGRNPRRQPGAWF